MSKLVQLNDYVTRYGQTIYVAVPGSSTKQFTSRHISLAMEYCREKCSQQGLDFPEMPSLLPSGLIWVTNSSQELTGIRAESRTRAQIFPLQDFKDEQSAIQAAYTWLLRSNANYPETFR